MGKSSLVAVRQRKDISACLRATVVKIEIGSPQLVVISGLRRVGKTLLARHLLADVDDRMTTVYVEATEAGGSRQLERFHAALLAAVGDVLPPGPVPATWEQALGLAAFAARRRPLVVVIDEATYIMASTPGFASEVQVVWDSMVVEADPPRLALILTGSQIGLTEDALSNQGALYQRPTLSLRIDPFTPAEAYQFVGRPDPTSFLEAYAACGGYPLHLDRWDFEAPTAHNLLRLAGTPGGLLLEDGTLTLARLSEPARRVLIAIGSGRTKLSEIANELGRPERHIDSLVRSRLVRPHRAVGAPRQARPSFRVADVYLQFYFSLLASNVQLIESGQGAAVLDHMAPEWQGHLGATFEAAARLHASHLVSTGELPSGTLVDEWWTTSGEKAQVDVLGLGRDGPSSSARSSGRAGHSGTTRSTPWRPSCESSPDPWPNPACCSMGGVGCARRS